MGGRFQETIYFIKQHIYNNSSVWGDLTTPLMQDFLLFFETHCLAELKNPNPQTQYHIEFKFNYMGTKPMLEYMVENAKISFQYDKFDEQDVYEYEIAKCQNIYSKEDDEPLYMLRLLFKTVIFKHV